MLFEHLKFEILFSVFDISAGFVEYQGKYSRILLYIWNVTMCSSVPTP